MRSRSIRDRHPSQYDNVKDSDSYSETSHEKNCSMLSQTLFEDGVINQKQSSFSSMKAVHMDSVDG